LVELISLKFLGRKGKEPVATMSCPQFGKSTRDHNRWPCFPQTVLHRLLNSPSAIFDARESSGVPWELGSSLVYLVCVQTRQIYLCLSNADSSVYVELIPWYLCEMNMIMKVHDDIIVAFVHGCFWFGMYAHPVCMLHSLINRLLCVNYSVQLHLYVKWIWSWKFMMIS
jgi:hypothetical protein